MDRSVAEQSQERLHMAQQRQRFEQLAARLWRQRSRLAELAQRPAVPRHTTCGDEAASRRTRYCTMNSRSSSPPGPILEVPGRGPRVLLCNAPAHVGDVEHAGVRGRASEPAHWPITSADPPAQRRITGDRPRPCQRHMLPRPGGFPLIAREAGEARRDRSRRHPTAAAACRLRKSRPSPVRAVIAPISRWLNRAK